MENTVKCPYCSEEILQTALKCKHCNEWVKSKDQEGLTSQRLKQFKAEYGTSTFWAVVSFFIAQYVYLLLWIGERYRALNNLTGRSDKPVSRTQLVWMAILGNIINGIYVTQQCYKGTDDYWALVTLNLIIGIPFFVLFYKAIFRMARSLETFVHQETGISYKLNRLYLILFSIYYLNFKINRLDNITQE